MKNNIKRFKKYVNSSSQDNPKSTLDGYNYKEYPNHDFCYLSNNENILPIFVNFFGYDTWHKECLRRRTFSDTFSVEYVQKGVFLFQQNNIKMRVNPGEIFFVHLDQANSMQCETLYATKKVVNMKGPLLRVLLETLGLDRINMIVPKNRARIDEIFDKLFTLCEKTPIISQQEISILCYTLLVELADQASVQQYPEELLRALEYIQSRVKESLSLEDLAQYSGVSRASLHRYFRKYLNTSPINYYLNQKLARAKILLENHLYSIKEVAVMLNYASPQYFASEFKKRYGFSPKNCKRGGAQY